MALCSEDEEVKAALRADCGFCFEGGGWRERVKGRGALWVVLLSWELFELQHLSVRQLSISLSVSGSDSLLDGHQPANHRI